MSYTQYNSNPYASGPAAEGNYPYEGQGQYEMQPYGQQPHQQYQQQQNPYSAAPASSQYQTQPQSHPQGRSQGQSMSQQEFLAQVSHLRGEISQVAADVDYISQLHQRSLASTEAGANQALDQYVSSAQARNMSLSNDIKDLERDLLNTTDGSRTAKQNQLNALKSSFKKELQRFQTIESEYQKRYREQIARQFRIVNPDASEAEVREAAEADWGDEGVFQTALRSNRTGQATAVLGNVRARHNELKRIEQTLQELAILFHELSIAIEQQQPVIDQALNNAEATVENMTKGNEQVGIATKHARNRRKLKWWCLFVVILIILIGVGVGVGVCFGTGTCKANNNG